MSLSHLWSVREFEREALRVPQYKMAIKSQETVITRMESLLTDALQSKKELKVHSLHTMWMGAAAGMG